MATLLGDGDFVYEELASWAKLPDGVDFFEAVDVAVDQQDRVTRSVHLIGYVDIVGAKARHLVTPQWRKLKSAWRPPAAPH